MSKWQHAVPVTKISSKLQHFGFSKFTSNSCDRGLILQTKLSHLPLQPQTCVAWSAIVWNDAGLLMKDHWEIPIKFQSKYNHFIKENAFDLSSAKWQPFCLSLNPLSLPGIMDLMDSEDTLYVRPIPNNHGYSVLVRRKGPGQGQRPLGVLPVLAHHYNDVVGTPWPIKSQYLDCLFNSLTTNIIGRLWRTCGRWISLTNPR